MHTLENKKQRRNNIYAALKKVFYFCNKKRSEIVMEPLPYREVTQFWRE